MAWPRVWPKFKSIRSPCSFSSFSTTCRLMSMQRAIISSRKPWTSSASIRENRSLSLMHPALTASAMPSEKYRPGRVERVPMSQSTREGCQKAPTRFLPTSRSTPVLPPTELSTWASREVGICTKGIPRR